MKRKNEDKEEKWDTCVEVKKQEKKRKEKEQSRDGKNEERRKNKIEKCYHNILQFFHNKF